MPQTAERDGHVMGQSTQHGSHREPLFIPVGYCAHGARIGEGAERGSDDAPGGAGAFFGINLAVPLAQKPVVAVVGHTP